MSINKTLITKVRLWKMAVLYIVTFGLYGLFWYARSRNEINRNYKTDIPHWLWLVLPGLAITTLAVAVAMNAFQTDFDVTATLILSIVFIVIACIAAFVISMWWMYRYGQLAVKLTEGRVGIAWILVFWFAFSPVVMFMLQYYYNRGPELKHLPAKLKYQPSQKFVVIALIILGLVYGGSSLTASIPYEDIPAIKNEIQNVNSKYEESERLYEEYQACTAKLEAMYPGELTEENQAAYDADYAKCEEIRVKQNAASDLYNEAAVD